MNERDFVVMQEKLVVEIERLLIASDETPVLRGEVQPTFSVYRAAAVAAAAVFIAFERGYQLLIDESASE